MRTIAISLILLVVSGCGPIHLEGAASLSVGEGQRIQKTLKSSVEQDA